MTSFIARWDLHQQDQTDKDYWPVPRTNTLIIVSHNPAESFRKLQNLWKGKPSLPPVLAYEQRYLLEWYRIWSKDQKKIGDLSSKLPSRIKSICTDCLRQHTTLGQSRKERPGVDSYTLPNFSYYLKKGKNRLCTMTVDSELKSTYNIFLDLFDIICWSCLELF